MHRHCLHLCWLGLASLIAACSLVVDDKVEQCSRNADCARFGNAWCDVATYTCKASAPLEEPDDPPPRPDAGSSSEPKDAAATSDGQARPVLTSDAGAAISAPLDGGCRPSATPNLNACTNARCRPFDNRARLKKLTVGGGLPPLPPLVAAGHEIN